MYAILCYIYQNKTIIDSTLAYWYLNNTGTVLTQPDLFNEKCNANTTQASLWEAYCSYTTVLKKFILSNLHFRHMVAVTLSIFAPSMKTVRK